MRGPLEQGARQCGGRCGHRPLLADMMDGRIGRIRIALEAREFIHTRIISVFGHIRFGFYGPFRDAIGSCGELGKGSKFTYQMDPPNSDVRFGKLADRAGGCNMVMVKPGMPYLDIVAASRMNSRRPDLRLSGEGGEYSMFGKRRQERLAHRDTLRDGSARRIQARRATAS